MVWQLGEAREHEYVYYWTDRPLHGPAVLAQRYIYLTSGQILKFRQQCKGRAQVVIPKVPGPVTVDVSRWTYNPQTEIMDYGTSVRYRFDVYHPSDAETARLAIERLSRLPDEGLPPVSPSSVAPTSDSTSFELLWRAPTSNGLIFIGLCPTYVVHLTLEEDGSHFRVQQLGMRQAKTYRYTAGPSGDVFPTKEEALQFAENWFLSQVTTPMTLLTEGLVKSNPRSTRRKYVDSKGRSIPARYLKGLPKNLKEKRIQELGKSRDAYKYGDYSELPTDKAARKLGLVKQSAYSIVAEERGIEWRGDAYDMAQRVLKHYRVKASSDKIDEMADAIQLSYDKGLAAWKSGGHRPGATATNWAVARVASLVVGGKTAWTADSKQFKTFPPALRKKIVDRFEDVADELRDQGRYEDVEAIQRAIKGKAGRNPKKARRNPNFDGAVVAVKDKKGRILLLRRSATDPWKPGFWNFPGGRIEPKEKPEQAATRELHEEAGLTVNRLFPMGEMDSGLGWKVHVFVAQPSDWEGRVRLDSENDEFVWITKEEARRLPLIPTVADILALV